MTELRNVLESTVMVFNKYVVLPDGAPETIALYIICTHLLDVAWCAPILILRSPEMRCGKTSTMELISGLVRDPLAAANASPAALFRAVDQRHPTLMLDEVDSFLQHKSETSEAVRGILNAGHRRGQFSKVMRAGPQSKDFEPRELDVFGFKVLAGIGDLHGTLSDRAIVVTLRRKLPSERRERLRARLVAPELAAVQEQIDAMRLPTTPTKKSDSRSSTFEGESVEVDAIPPAVLKQMAKKSITAHIDQERYYRMRQIEREERDMVRRLSRDFPGRSS